MARNGRVEVLSQEFVLGWAETVDGAPAHLNAILDDCVIGSGVANLKRKDLDELASKGGIRANSFVLLFDREVDQSRVGDIEVYCENQRTALTKAQKLRVDRTPPLRVLVLGSPRSGTSELGDTLATQLQLPWLGEGHAAPLFAAAANALGGDINSPNGLVRFMAQQEFRQIAVNAARTAYYAVHASASFLDKTPGHPMIGAAPFLLECFPDAKFLFLYRNGISNILSRMVKFGGDFETHCTDWTRTMTEWLRVKSLLPHFLEVRQEDMLNNPLAVAQAVTQYLGVPDKAAAIANSLGSGSRERTGAGIGRSSLSQTNWSSAQIARFKTICGPMMQAFNYSMEA
jgi:hypothetical protein